MSNSQKKLTLLILTASVILPFFGNIFAAADHSSHEEHTADHVAHESSGHGGHHAKTAYPIPLTDYDDKGLSVKDQLIFRIKQEPFNLVASIIFLLAVSHTFMAGKFLQIAHKFEHEHEEKIKREGRTASDKLLRHVMAKKQAQLRQMVQNLSSIAVIRALPPSEINNLIKFVQQVNFSVGSTIFNQGEEGDSLYLLEQGEVEVIIDDNAVATLVQGESFGEMALLTKEQRNATIKTKSPVKAWKINKQDFDELAQNSPTLMAELRKLGESRHYQNTPGEDHEWNELAIKHVKTDNINITEQDKEDAGDKHVIDDVSFWATFFDFHGEVEAIFGMWAIPLFVGMIIYFADGWHIGEGWHTATNYVGHDLDFTEPVFVVIIMSIASTRPILRFSEKCLKIVANLGNCSPAAWWMSILTLAPILGSFITEPAAMTIGAMLLSRQFYNLNPSNTLKYATIGALFVNISIGGTLTHFAAPPVLMVAGVWNWDMPYMFFNFGWKAAIAVVIINIVYWQIFRKEFNKLGERSKGAGESVADNWLDREDPIPAMITVVHLLMLAWTVLVLHYPPLFIGGFLFFIAFMTITEHHQNFLQLKSALLVGFFLSGLKIHGELQGWWISPVLTGLMTEFGDLTLFIGSATLTAFNDNAAITLLASLVPDFNATDPAIIADAVKLEFAVAAQQAVVAGAVTGGGLTVIANAPNPAGQSILNKHFIHGVSPLKLFFGAALPTFIVSLVFRILA